MFYKTSISSSNTTGHFLISNYQYNIAINTKVLKVLFNNKCAVTYVCIYDYMYCFYVGFDYTQTHRHRRLNPFLPHKFTDTNLAHHINHSVTMPVLRKNVQ